MAVKVETYYHPKEWHKHKAIEEIKDEIHICATKNIAEGITERYRDDNVNEFQYIFTIHQVLSNVFRDWHSPERMLEQYLSISKIINTVKGKKELKDAFRNNTTDLLETIRFLVFSGVSPNSLKGIPHLTEKEKFFADIWDLLENQDSLYTDFRRLLRGQWKIDIIQKRMNEILERRYQKEEDILLVLPSNKKKIVLHGFYFITPEQQVFLKLLERTGFELFFFQFYDDRFPNTFDFSRAFISQRYGWTDNWSIQVKEKTFDTVAAKFLRSFEEGIQKKWVEKKEVLAYESFFDFLHSVVMEHYPIGEESKDKKKDVEIIATNADILNGLLVQYYPERFADRRNFLNYPVGQFILKIHEMRQGNRFILNEDILMTSFSSGWLTDKDTNENARRYTYELKQLLPYFVGCVDLEDWLLRIQDLLNQYYNILPLFESEGDNRVLESIRSPFSKLSYLSLDKKDVTQVQSFLLLLKDMAKDLFDMSNDETSINEHFKRLSHLMKEHNPISSTNILQKAEEKLIEKLNYKISTIDDNHQFLYEDIGKAIQFYLSGTFSDNEETIIKPFIEVDGEAFKENNRKVYLTGLDEQGLPLGKFNIPWPLQEGTYSFLSDKHLELELNELRNKSVKDISRYLLFFALEFVPIENIELSWMRNFLDRENLQPAVYVQYLNMKIKDRDFKFNNDRQVPYNQFNFNSYQPKEVDLQIAVEDLKYEDILADFLLCPRRFYFGYVLDRYSTFSDAFIHQFIFSEIIMLVKRYTKKDDGYVIAMVSELFPQWTSYQKENMATTSLRYVGSGNDIKNLIEGNVSVSETRRNFQFPGLTTKKRKELYDLVNIKKENIMESILEPDADLSIIMDAKSGYHCRYCPFLDLCPEGNYAIDGKGKD